MLEIAEAEAAPFFFDGDAVQSELTHLRPQVAREFVRFIDLGGDRFDLIFGKAPRSLADRIGHLAEVEIESGLGHARSPVRRGASREVAALETAAIETMPRRHLNKRPPSL